MYPLFFSIESCSNVGIDSNSFTSSYDEIFQVFFRMTRMLFDVDIHHHVVAAPVNVRIVHWQSVGWKHGPGKEDGRKKIRLSCPTPVCWVVPLGRGTGCLFYRVWVVPPIFLFPPPFHRQYYRPLYPLSQTISRVIHYYTMPKLSI